MLSAPYASGVLTKVESKQPNRGDALDRARRGAPAETVKWEGSLRVLVGDKLSRSFSPEGSTSRFRQLTVIMQQVCDVRPGDRLHVSYDGADRVWVAGELVPSHPALVWPKTYTIDVVDAEN